MITCTIANYMLECKLKVKRPIITIRSTSNCKIKAKKFFNRGKMIAYLCHLKAFSDNNSLHKESTSKYITVVSIRCFSFLFCSFSYSGVCSTDGAFCLWRHSFQKKSSTGDEISSAFLCFVSLTHCIIVSCTCRKTIYWRLL